LLFCGPSPQAHVAPKSTPLKPGGKIATSYNIFHLARVIVEWQTPSSQNREYIMETREIVASIANGTITCMDKTEDASHIVWAAHPSFQGVYLKHLVKGDATDGQLSCHMVRIDPGCVLEEHIHAEQWELHEVLDGAGQGWLDTQVLAYHPGQMTVIPQGTKHRVQAGEDGLVLLAKFFPALI
jgi:quercetin dioxygenase-like cupin family protein